MRDLESIRFALTIAETGHLVFMAFGDVIHVAGGTLFQLIVPAAFVVYFARRGDRHAATVPLWWVGEVITHLAFYVGWPNAFSALPIAKEGFEKRRH